MLRRLAAPLGATLARPPLLPAAATAAPARAATALRLAGARALCQHAAPSSGGGSILGKAAARYEMLLETRPLLTKSVTSGVLYGVGDWIGQTIERRNKPAGEVGQFDAARWCRAVAYGGIFYPGLAHVHYNFLEWLVVVKWATPVSRKPKLSHHQPVSRELSRCGAQVCRS